MSPSIICGIDDSIHARAASRLTLALAERLALRPVVVHAVPGTVAPLMPVLPHRVPMERGELVLAAREAGERLLEATLPRSATPRPASESTAGARPTVSSPRRRRRTLR